MNKSEETANGPYRAVCQLIQGFLKRLAGRELYVFRGRNGHGFTSAGVSSHTGCAFDHPESAEAEQGNAVIGGQGLCHGRKCSVDHSLYLLLGAGWAGCSDGVDEVDFFHVW